MDNKESILIVRMLVQHMHAINCTVFHDTVSSLLLSSGVFSLGNVN